MTTDLIVEEIRKFRDEYAKRFNYDVRAMLEDLKKEQQASGRKVVSFATGTPRSQPPKSKPPLPRHAR